MNCALEIARTLQSHPDLRVRIGIHSGPVQEVTDLNEQTNVAGAGINIAQRVMDCGDAGHILLSKRVADDLEQYARWRPLLHELGSYQVKHGLTLGLVNLYSDKIGNTAVPQKLKETSTKASRMEPATAVPRKSIAVLPFESLSEDKSNVYFAEGIQEEILTKLSSIKDLKVISRTSTQRFRAATDNIRDIAKQLGVAHILEGSVQKAGNKVRVRVQLIDAESDDHLWAERYDRELVDIFAVETDIAEKVASSLQARLTGDERRAITTAATSNTEAHEYYLKGRYFWRNFYAPGYERVRDCFEKAIEIDPSYALAYAGLALYYSFAGANAIFRPEDAWPQSEASAQKAYSLAPDLAEVYNSLAALELYDKRDWPAAERAFKRGMELNPNFADIPHHYALCLALFGRGEESMAYMDRASSLDPFFPGGMVHRGRILYFRRDYDQAIAQLARTLEVFPAYATAHEYYGDACEQKGMAHEAVIQWRAALKLSGEHEQADILEDTFRRDGFEPAKRALAERQIADFNRKAAQGAYIPASSYVFAYIRANALEQALKRLPDMIKQRDWFPLQVRVNPIFDPIRHDSRFQEVAGAIFSPGERATTITSA